MQNYELRHAASRTTSRLLDFATQSFDRSTIRFVTSGLPAGSMHLMRAGLIVGGTPCTIPLFGAAMERVAVENRCDVLIARHGMHPEVLDPVLWDAVIWCGNHTTAIADLVLYADPDCSYWLVPSRVGPHIRIASNGLHLEPEPPFKTWHQRCDGVCLAAKRIVVAANLTEER